ncbi:MAG: hypothetical protein HY880_06565, partial [Deltaproteobacteria bacterium]|nr:hypothetical protein [Deltaproteobacteria bacterium]
MSFRAGRIAVATDEQTGLFKAYEQALREKGAVVKKLAMNYRSFSNIVSASTAVVENNKKRVERQMDAMSEGGFLSIVECSDETAEGLFIIKEIDALMQGLVSFTAKSRDYGHGLGFSDFAVLTRTNQHA